MRYLADHMIEWVANRCRLAPQDVDPDRPFVEFGLSSIDAVEVAGVLEQWLGRQLPATLLWQYPTINALVAGLTASHTAEEKRQASDIAEPIAIVGLGCRFPGGAEDPDSLWRLLIECRDAIGDVSPERWRWFDDGSPATALALARADRRGGYLADVASFDAEFFGISAAEARLMDPQQRILLEVTWEALQHAAIDPTRLRGSRAGVYVGICASEYAHLTSSRLDKVEGWTATGGALSIAANRLSYLLDLRGPSLAVDTACSSSLVAMHLAARDIRAGDTDLALVAGVNLLLTPVLTVAFGQAGGLAPGGRCRPFDASADGIVRGEGCGVVVLKPLSAAIRAGDRVLALLRGSATNSDGRSNGLVAPNPQAQESLLRRAYSDAGVDPSTVDYIEAHGTGTQMGDPIEAGALHTVFGIGRPAENPLLLGSIKSNLGHLEAAAGIAGVIKTVLALRNGVIPPTIHFRQPNPYIPFADWRLRVVDAVQSWPVRSHPARAGVSAFGFGGANAHVVLEAYVPTQAPGTTVTQSFVLADQDTNRVQAQASSLSRWLRTAGDVATQDVASTLSRRGQRGRVRAVIAMADLADGLSAIAEGRRHERVVTGAGCRAAERGVWMFSGYGGHWPGMGRDLLAGEPVFAAAVDELDPLFRAEIGLSLREGLESSVDHGVAHAQPLTFGLQVALAALWRSYGVEPGAVIGHSMGEVAAAVVSGALSLADGMKVIAHRARLLATVGPGAMAVVEMSKEEFANAVDGRQDVHIAVVAAPRQLVVTGTRPGVAALVRRVEVQGRVARMLTTDGAGHSPAVDHLAPALRTALADLRPSPPNIPFYSTVFPAAESTLDAEYWAANLRRPVQLVDAVAAAADDGLSFFLEISPHPVLVRPVTETLRQRKVTEPLVAASMRRDSSFQRSLANLYAHGMRAPAPSAVSILDLPSAPWRRERYWFGSALLNHLLGVAWVQSPLLGNSSDVHPAYVVVSAPRDGVERAEEFALAVAEAARRAVTTGARLWIVTSGGVSVGPDETADADFGWVHGFVRTLALEQPGIRATWLDLDPDDDAEALLNKEIRADSPDDEIAWRRGRRYAARLVRIPPPQSRDKAVVREGAAYLITGGYRGIGLCVAQWLAKKGAGRLVLAGRTGPPPESEFALEAMRRSGVDVRVMCGDIATEGVAMSWVAEAGPRLAGVVHAAAVLDDRVITNVGADDIHRVWAPKVDGARLLHDAIKKVDLDWWLSFSSAAALLGSPGQAVYSGANAWLDGFAHWQRSQGIPAWSVGWGPWAQVGGATGVRIPGLDPIETADGVAALEGLLCGTPASVGILHFDPGTAVAAFPNAGRIPFFSQLVRGTSDPPEWNGPAGLDRIGARVAAVLGSDKPPPRDMPLTDLGLDSLAAIRIKNLVEADFGVSIPTSVLVRGATLADLELSMAQALGLAGFIGPRDAAEREAIRLFEMVLGRNGIGITQRLDSREQAERLIEALQRDIDIDVALPDLQANPTPEWLATALRVADESEVEGLLRPLCEARGLPPLLLAHPAGGTTRVYHQLVKLLDQSCFGLERLDEGGTVQERAARYVELIRDRWPAGPYRIGGWSFGGAIAFEVACQLTSSGDKVDHVALIDAGLPAPVEPSVADELLVNRFVDFTRYLRETYQLDIDVDPAELRLVPEDEQFDLVMARCAAAGLTRRLPAAVLRHQVTSHQDTRALDRYRPGEYAGPVTLYRSTQPTPWNVSDPRYEHTDAARGWDRHCTDLRIVSVPGHHLNLLDPPIVQMIATDLRSLFADGSRSR